LRSPHELQQPRQAITCCAVPLPQVVIADDREPGYFMALWQRLSWPHPVRVLRQQPFADHTCLRTALLAPYAAHTQSLLTYKAGSADEVLCESLLLQAASRWLRHLFRDLLPPGLRAARPTAGGGGGSSGDGSGARWMSSRLHGHGGFSALDLAPLLPSATQSALPLEALHVVWLSRRRYERQHAHELTDWQKTRALPAAQQERLLAELQRAVARWNAETCVAAAAAGAAAGSGGCKARSVLFTLQVAELSELSFWPDQLALLMRAGVLAGVHGAGLANQVFMAPRQGAVVEVWYRMEGNMHYHNMAHMLGHAYRTIKCEDELDVPGVVAAVVAGMDQAAARHDAAARERGQLSSSGRSRRWWAWVSRQRQRLEKQQQQQPDGDARPP
jgi:hypothetical protein